MNIHRIYAIVLRHLYNFKHSYDRMSDVFYWPAIDLLIWGLTLSYFKTITDGDPRYANAILAAIIFWTVTWRSQYEVSINLLAELWDRNLVNIFVTPIKFSEWVASLIILGLVKASISLIFVSLLAYFFFDFNILTYGLYIIPFLLILITAGWWIGFTIAAIILHFGTRIQTLAWTVVWATAPFSAIYFPVMLLPEWAQKIAFLMPTSYVFEGVREIANTGTLGWEKVTIGLLLNLVYCTLAILFFKRSFKKAINRGLMSVE